MKIKYVILAIVGLVSGHYVQRAICCDNNKINKVMFHYCGNIKRVVNLEKYEYGYIEDSTITKSNIILNNPQTTAMVAKLIFNSTYEKNDIPLEISDDEEISYISEDYSAFEPFTGGSACLCLLRSNCMILNLTHSK